MTILVACGLKREAKIIRRVGAIPVVGGGDAVGLENLLEDDITCLGPFSAILSSGIAGALDPALRVGDVVIDGDSSLVERLGASLPAAKIGKVIGRDAIVGSVDVKHALWAETGALAVDMESHVAGRVAVRHGLPFAVLRTISDDAAHALPPAALVGMRSDGGIALNKVLSSLAKNPAQLPALIRTGRDAERAAASLAAAWSTFGG